MEHLHFQFAGARGTEEARRAEIERLARRKEVSTEPGTSSSATVWGKSGTDKSREKHSLVEIALRSIHATKGMSNVQIAALIKATTERTYTKGAIVIGKGAILSQVCIVCSGEFEEVEKGNAVYALHAEGSYFGDEALVYSSRARMMVRCSRAGSIMALDGAIFRAVQRHAREAVESQTLLQFLTSLQPLAKMSKSDLQLLAAAAEGGAVDAEGVREGDAPDPSVHEVVVPSGEVVFSEGDAANSLFIVLRGTGVPSKLEDESDDGAGSGTEADSFNNSTSKGKGGRDYQQRIQSSAGKSRASVSSMPPIFGSRIGSIRYVRGDFIGVDSRLRESRRAISRVRDNPAYSATT